MNREIVLYHLESRTCPVKEFFETLTDAQFEKVAFVLDLDDHISTI